MLAVKRDELRRRVRVARRVDDEKVGEQRLLVRNDQPLGQLDALGRRKVLLHVGDDTRQLGIPVRVVLLVAVENQPVAIPRADVVKRGVDDPQMG